MAAGVFVLPPHHSMYAFLAPLHIYTVRKGVADVTDDAIAKLHET